jgi:hypothetical protein
VVVAEARVDLLQPGLGPAEVLHAGRTAAGCSAPPAAGPHRPWPGRGGWRNPTRRPAGPRVGWRARSGGPAPRPGARR